MFPEVLSPPYCTLPRQRHTGGESPFVPFPPAQGPQALWSKLALGAEDELLRVLRRKQKIPALTYSKTSLPLTGSSAQSGHTALGTHLLWPLANGSNLADWEGRCVTGEDTVSRDHLWQGVEETV